MKLNRKPERQRRRESGVKEEGRAYKLGLLFTLFWPFPDKPVGKASQIGSQGRSQMFVVWQDGSPFPLQLRDKVVESTAAGPYDTLSLVDT